MDSGDSYGRPRKCGLLTLWIFQKDGLKLVSFAHDLGKEFA